MNGSSPLVSTHQDPVWRERSNFIFGANVIEEGRWEQLWGRQVGDLKFEICCIPFFVYGMALGDVVETDEDFMALGVVKAANRAVFRVWFGGSSYPKDDVENRVRALGGLVEWSSSNLMAVDAVEGEIAENVFAHLAAHHAQDHLAVETGRWNRR